MATLKRLYFILLCICSSQAFAVGIHPIFIMDYEFGGDTLVSTNLGDVKAGTGIHLAFGAYISEYSEKMETLISLGWKNDSVSGSNGDISFKRNPIEIIQFFRFKRPRGWFRIGAGVTLHKNVQFECDVIAVCFGQVDYDDATGLAIRADLNLPFLNSGAAIKGIFVGMRITRIEYSIPGFAGTDSGDAVGFGVGAYF